MIYTIKRSQTLELESGLISFRVDKVLNPEKTSSRNLRLCIDEIRKSSSDEKPFHNNSIEWGLVKGALLKIHELVYPFSTNLSVDISRHNEPEIAGDYLEVGYNFIRDKDKFKEWVYSTPDTQTVWHPIEKELEIEIRNEGWQG